MIPLTLQVGDTYMVDDETFDQARFLKLVDESAECPKSACPSPESFKLAYEAADAEGIFVVTLSQHLSGTYNSAQLAKNLYEEEHGKDKKIAVFSSDSAASGESLIALKIQELCEAGLSFEEVVEQISDVYKRQALDDSNVGRFANYLNKLKSNTQFIVITHRRGTMLIADQLYGITMQEKGVSSLVSVDLTDEAKAV